jgi:hypothetical protein
MTKLERGYPITYSLQQINLAFAKVKHTIMRKMGHIKGVQARILHFQLQSLSHSVAAIA